MKNVITAPSEKNIGLPVEAQLIVTISRNEPLQNRRTQVLEKAGFSVVAFRPRCRCARLFANRPSPRYPSGADVPFRPRAKSRQSLRCPKGTLSIDANPHALQRLSPTKAQVDGSLLNVDTPEALLDMIGFLTAG